jgi:hypothetical protein
LTHGAWRLANTILFSLALELKAVNSTDIQRVFQRLVKIIESGCGEYAFETPRELAEVSVAPFPMKASQQAVKKVPLD